MIKELALAALSNYLSGSPGSGESSDGAGFLKELQRAHDGRAADPANRASAPRPDAAQPDRTPKPAEQPPRRTEGAQTRSDGSAKPRSDAGRPAAAQQASRNEDGSRTTRAAERDGQAADAGAARPADDGSTDAARSERADGTDDSADADRVAADAALALLAGAPATSDPVAATAEAAAQVLAAVRRTQNDAGTEARDEPSVRAITDPDSADGRGPADTTLEVADTADAPGDAGSGRAGDARARRAALDAADLQQAGLDRDDRPLAASAQALAANLAQSSRGASTDHIGALDGAARHDRSAGMAAGHGGELPAGLAAGFANALARAEASAASAAPVTTAVHAPLGSQAFAPEFAERISTLVAGGIERAEIVVSPKELGPVRIELTMNGDDARLVFTAAHPDTRQAIEQSSALLRSMLADQGLTLGRMDVGQGGDPQAGNGQQAHANAGSDAGAGQTWSGGGTTVTAPATTAPRGLLDLFA